MINPNYDSKVAHHSAKQEEKRISPLFGYILPIILGTMLISLTASSYSALRILKDSFMQKYANPMALNFIKSTLIFGLSFILPLFLSALNKAVPNSRHRFYYLIAPFFVVYSAIYFIFPYCEQLQTSRFMVELHEMGLGNFGIGIGGALGYWIFTIFSVSVEAWGMFAISLMGWGVVNNMLPELSEETRNIVYTFMSTVANICSLLSTMSVENFSKAKKGAEFISVAQGFLRQLTIYTIIAMVICHGLMTLLIKEKEKKSDKDENSEKVDINPYRAVFSDKYYICIGLMVASYNFCIMAVDFFSKPAIGDLVENSGMEWSQFQSLTYQCNSIASVIIGLLNMLFFSHMSMGARALMSVFTMGITGTIFFISYIFLNSSPMVAAALSGMLMTSGNQMIIMATSTQMVGSKAAKYAGFDPGKEGYMKIIVRHLRDIIKGVIDTAFNRVSKSSGAQLGYLLLFFVAFYDMSGEKKLQTLLVLGKLGLKAGVACIALWMTFTSSGRSSARRYWYLTIPCGLFLETYCGYAVYNWILPMNMDQRYMVAWGSIVLISFVGIIRCLTSVGARRLRYALALIFSGLLVFSSYKAQRIYSRQPVISRELILEKTKKKDRDLKLIAPIMALAFLIVVVVWGASLYTIHPIYQKKKGIRVTGITLRETAVILIATIGILALTVYGIADFFAYKGIIVTKIPKLLRASQNMYTLLYTAVTCLLMTTLYSVLFMTESILKNLRKISADQDHQDQKHSTSSSLVRRFRFIGGAISLVALIVQQLQQLKILKLKYSLIYVLTVSSIAFLLVPICIALRRLIKYASPSEVGPEGHNSSSGQKSSSKS